MLPHGEDEEEEDQEEKQQEDEKMKELGAQEQTETTCCGTHWSFYVQQKVFCLVA